MAYPPKPDLQTSYTAVEQALGDGSLPGQELDVDFANLKSSLDALNDFVRGVTRSDGRLGNGVVTQDTLAADILLGLEPPEPWVTGKVYKSPNTVFENNRFYLAAIEHTSGVFNDDVAAGRWLLLADFTLGDPVPGGRTITAAGLATGGGDLTENRTITVPVASQAEAEAGSINDKAMTPLRTAQAVAAQRPLATQGEAETGTNNTAALTPLRGAQQTTARLASQAEAETGTDNTKLLTPLRAAQQTTVRIASQAEAEAGTDSAKLMTPQRVRQAVPLLTQAQAEDAASTVFGAVSGERLRQAVATQAVGLGQTWQSPSRTHSTSYQNTSGRPIMVLARTRGAGTVNWEISSNGSSWSAVAYATANGDFYNTSFVVPAGWYYRINGTATIDSWQELRA
jgi:hypothetical protein